MRSSENAKDGFFVIHYLFLSPVLSMDVKKYKLRGGNLDRSRKVQR